MLEEKLNENMPFNDNQIAMLGHLIGLLSCLNGIYGLIGTIIFYFVCAGKNAFIKAHAGQALNFQITFFVVTTIIEYGLFGVLWRFIMSFVTSTFENIGDNHMGWFSSFFSGMGIIVIVNAVFMLFNLVSCLRAASKANNGETWSSRFAFHFVK